MTRRCLRVSKLSYVEQLPANYLGVFMPAIEVFIGALLCDVGRLPPISPIKKCGMYVCMSVSLSICLSLCMYVCMYVCTYVRTYVHTDVRRYVCMHACMHVCMSVCMYVTGNAWIETNERACWALQDRKSILNTFYKVFRILSIVQDRQQLEKRR